MTVYVLLCRPTQRDEEILSVEAAARALGVSTRTVYNLARKKEGALDTAKLLCPAMLEVNLDDGTQSGGGRCIIQAASGDRVYARWTCAGEHGAGCKGPFTLLSGTGKFKGITGQGEFQIRSDIAVYVAEFPGDSVTGKAAGVAIWPALTYKIP